MLIELDEIVIIHLILIYMSSSEIVFLLGKENALNYI